MSASMGTGGCADPRGERARRDARTRSRCCRRGLACRGREFFVQLAKGCDFRGADEGEILGPEEVHLPFARVVDVGESLERLVAIVGADVAVSEYEGMVHLQLTFCFS